MARIVAVHGIAKQYMGEETLLTSWLPALRDGLRRARAPAICDDDFGLAFYGDIFRPPGKALMPYYDANDVTDSWEVEFLEMLWREAARMDKGVQAPETVGKARWPKFIQRALDTLCNSQTLGPLTERALIGELKQVKAYLNDESVRTAILERVSACVHDDTRVIIGHSLGSVIAYEAVADHPEWLAGTLVTLGSPLGIANIIFNKLRPQPVNGLGIWPGMIKRWINIADEGDIVALEKRLATKFGPRVQDHLIHNGGTPHDVVPYLTALETGQAVARALSD